MRLFAAIPLPLEVKNQISSLTKNRLPVAYVNTSNLHVTLCFLGELNSVRSQIAISVFNSLTPSKTFQVNFDKLTKFRNQIHLIVTLSKELENLQQNLQQQYESQGFYFIKRSYYAHVKLANLHMDKVMNPERKIESFPNELLAELSFTASKIVLYESVLKMHHAYHVPISEINLINN